MPVVLQCGLARSAQPVVPWQLVPNRVKLSPDPIRPVSRSPRHHSSFGIPIHSLLHLFKKIHGLGERSRGLFSQHSLLMGFQFAEPGLKLRRLWASEVWGGIGCLARNVCTVAEGDGCCQK